MLDSFHVCLPVLSHWGRGSDLSMLCYAQQATMSKHCRNNIKSMSKKWRTFGCIWDRQTHPKSVLPDCSTRQTSITSSLCRWIGETAMAEAKALRKIKGEERPHPTSLQGILEPPVVKGKQELKDFAHLQTLCILLTSTYCVEPRPRLALSAKG